VRSIVVRGARAHNLRDVSVTIPIGSLVVITGPSGSGKSSLAFDTLFAEGQRRYVESLSLHAQSVVGALPRPDVDYIEGLPPVVGVRAARASARSRATVGSITDVLAFLRLVFARVGRVRCLDGSEATRGMTPAQMTESLFRTREEGARFSVVAPLIGLDGLRVEAFIREGWSRFEVDGQVVEAHDLEKSMLPRATVLVDRLALKERARKRIREAFEQALEVGDGRARAVFASGESVTFSESPACPGEETPPEPSLELMSSEHPLGACPACEGGGVLEGEAEDLEVECPACRGTRLSPAALRVRVGGRSLGDLLSMNVAELRQTLDTLELDATDAEIVARPLAFVRERLTSLERIGLSYLSLGRSARSLSGGELARVRLAHQLGLGLSGILYLLDEPTAGLHPADVDALLVTLRELRAQGHTLVVVEHALPVVEAADHVIELGPSAGAEGGRVVAEGTPAEVLGAEDAPTANALRRRVLAASGRPKARAHLRVRGARAHNLRGVDVDIPVGRITCLTGVSGSGKSSLLRDTILAAARGARCDAEVRGLERFDKVLVVDGSPLGSNARATPASAVGALEPMRELFAQLPEARARGWKPARFSFNVKGGRCDRCEGLGAVQVDMRFLPDVEVPCDACGGSRYRDETLEVRYKGHDFGQVLRLSVAEGARLFEAIPQIERRLSALDSVGLGYLRLGQSAATLSGGEAQRIKLARELARKSASPCLFLLDEPSRGLHLGEVQRLVRAFHALVDEGHTLVVIEHHLDVAFESDFLVDLGPGAGPEGGLVVAAGAPEEVAKRGVGKTAEALRAMRRAAE
jgi:excinuclease ABC subunit A